MDSSLNYLMVFFFSNTNFYKIILQQGKALYKSDKLHRCLNLQGDTKHVRKTKFPKLS